MTMESNFQKYFKRTLAAEKKVQARISTFSNLQRKEQTVQILCVLEVGDCVYSIKIIKSEAITRTINLENITIVIANKPLIRSS